MSTRSLKAQAPASTCCMTCRPAAALMLLAGSKAKVRFCSARIAPPTSFRCNPWVPSVTARSAETRAVMSSARVSAGPRASTSRVVWLSAPSTRATSA